MEGNALGTVAWENNVPMILVKGVSDYGNQEKNDDFHEYAAESAARFLIAFFQKHLTAVLKSRKSRYSNPK